MRAATYLALGAMISALAGCNAILGIEGGDYHEPDGGSASDGGSGDDDGAPKTIPGRALGASDATNVPDSKPAGPSREVAQFCSQLQANTTALDDARRLASNGTLNVPEAIGKCHMDGVLGGAWALQLSAPRRVEPNPGSIFDYSIDATLRLIHVDSTGAPAEIAPPLNPTFLGFVSPSLPNFSIKSDAHVHSIAVADVRDIDRDGDPELFTWSGSSFIYPSSSDLAGFIWTFKSGRIAPYADLPRIDRFVDFDSDGLLDIVSKGFESFAGPCGISQSKLAYSHEFLHHAKDDGTFDPGDGIARNFARAGCAGENGDLMVLREDRVDTRATAKRISCARIRGVSAKDLKDQLLAACPNVDWRGCTADNEGLMEYARYCPGWFFTLAGATPPVIAPF
jgi:hypothetical protein